MESILPAVAPLRTASVPVPTVESIQALRGVAAVLVLWAHLRFITLDVSPRHDLPPMLATSHGAIGVDLFFVISGYVICLTATKRHHSSLDFISARIARVVPLYLVVTVAAMIAKLFIVSPNPASFRSVWNGLFYVPFFDLGTYTSPPLAIGWTLSFEMWFYLVFSLLLLHWRPRWVAALLPAIFGVGSALASLYHGSWYFPRFMFHPFVLEFAMGCVVFQVQDRLRGALPWLLLFAGIAYQASFARHTGYLGAHYVELSQRMDYAWLRVSLWGLPTALIVAGLVGLERSTGFRVHGFLVWAGGLSYSLYLSHWFTIAILSRLLARYPWNASILTALVVAGICLVVAWATWRFVETPLTQWAQRYVKQRFSSVKKSARLPGA